MKQAVISKRPGPGRPKVGAEVLLRPVTLRLPPQMVKEIDTVVNERSLEGVDKATVIREMIALGLNTRKIGAKS